MASDRRLAEAEVVRRSVRAVHRYFERSIQERAEAAGFTLPQVRVLRHLTAHPGATVTTLGASLEISQSTASGIVARLVAKGVLERRAVAEDRRSAGLWPTAAVDAFMTGDRTEFVNGPAADLLDGLDREERHLVLSAMRLLTGRLQQIREAARERA